MHVSNGTDATDVLSDGAIVCILVVVYWLLFWCSVLSVVR